MWIPRDFYYSYGISKRRNNYKRSPQQPFGCLVQFVQRPTLTHSYARCTSHCLIQKRQKQTSIFRRRWSFRVAGNCHCVFPHINWRKIALKQYWSIGIIVIRLMLLRQSIPSNWWARCNGSLWRLFLCTMVLLLWYSRDNTRVPAICYP